MCDLKIFVSIENSKMLYAWKQRKTNSRDPLFQTFILAAKQDNRAEGAKGFDIMKGIIRKFTWNAEKIEEKFRE